MSHCLYLFMMPNLTNPLFTANITETTKNTVVQTTENTVVQTTPGTGNSEASATSSYDLKYKSDVPPDITRSYDLKYSSNVPSDIISTRLPSEINTDDNNLKTLITMESTMHQVSVTHREVTTAVEYHRTYRAPIETTKQSIYAVDSHLSETTEGTQTLKSPFKWIIYAGK